MGKNTIIAPEGAVYVKDVLLRGFPNGILNKGDVGCGATTYAIENDEPAIICCPSIQLIKNKQSQYPNAERNCSHEILGVMGGVYEDDIRGYLSSCSLISRPPKIMVTYDSFHKIKAVLGTELSNYRIVVDEYQELLKAALYRNKAILRLLEDVKGHEKITYLTATPFPEEYTPEELGGHKVHEIDWGRKIQYKPVRYKTATPLALVVRMINEHKAGGGYTNDDGARAEEYYFFINSVNGIRSIATNAGLTNDDVKVVCADNPDNRKTLGDIAVSNISDPNKPYTFCTSTVFYGSDFYSSSGLIIIVSDGRRKNTQLDISTDIMQIAGRIRNDDNPFKNTILHIYNTGFGTSREKFEQHLNDKIQFAEKTKEAFDALPEDQKVVITARIRMQDDDELALYDEKTNTISVNELKVNYLKYRFDCVDEVYRNGITLRETYAKAGYDVSVKQEWVRAEDYFRRLVSPPKFKRYYEDYVNAGSKGTIHGSLIRQGISREYPQMPDIVALITPQEMITLKYNFTKVKDLLYSRLPDTERCVNDELGRIIVAGNSHTLKYLKGLIADIYNKYLIRIAPTASAIEKYYKVRKTQISENGRRSHGYEILGKICLPEYKKAA